MSEAHHNLKLNLYWGYIRVILGILVILRLY